MRTAAGWMVSMTKNALTMLMNLLVVARKRANAGEGGGAQYRERVERLGTRHIVATRSEEDRNPTGGLRIRYMGGGFSEERRPTNAFGTNTTTHRV